MKKFCLLLVGLIGSFYLAGCAGPAVTVDDQHIFALTVLKILS
jgi:hypothetical protein